MWLMFIFRVAPWPPMAPLAQVGTRHRADLGSERVLTELRLVSAFSVHFMWVFLLNMTRVGVIKYMDLVRSPVNQHTGYHESILILYAIQSGEFWYWERWKKKWDENVRVAPRDSQRGSPSGWVSLRGAGGVAPPSGRVSLRGDIFLICHIKSP